MSPLASQPLEPVHLHEGGKSLGTMLPRIGGGNGPRPAGQELEKGPGNDAPPA